MTMMNNRVLDPKFASLLLESMADGVFTLNEKGKITLWNRAIEKITGYSADEVLGKSCDILDFNL
ncbi:MAG: PAS domain-containing protein [bacterium]